jgi:hypothetical protein
MSSEFLDISGSSFEINDLNEVVIPSLFPINEESETHNHEISLIPGLISYPMLEEVDLVQDTFDLWGDEYLDHQTRQSLSDYFSASKLLLEAYYAAGRNFKIPNDIHPEFILKHLDKTYLSILLPNIDILLQQEQISYDESKILTNLELIKTALDVLERKKILYSLSKPIKQNLRV